MKTPEECLEMLSAAYNCPDVAITETIKLIQLEALTQGRKEGREQGIKEVLSLHHALCDKDKEGDFLWHHDDVCSKSILSLLTDRSPKEQEK